MEVEKEGYDKKESESKSLFSPTNIFLAIFLLIIIGVHILAWQNPSFGEKLSVENMLTGDYTQASFIIAAGVSMLACFLGALIPIPIPYMLSVSTYSKVWAEESPSKWGAIIGLILLAALANTIGDGLDYVIGAGTEKVVKKDNPEISNKWGNIILKKPALIPWIIALFAVSPLPDSLLLVPLGIVKYPPQKTMLYMFIGKIFMMAITAVAGIRGTEFIINLVGGEGSWITGVLLLYAMWLMITIMVKFKPKGE